MKKRIIPIQLLLDGRLVKTRGFAAPRDVGDPVKSAGVYNSQNADELIFLNIARGERTIAPLRKVIEGVSEVSFMPIAIGGGIASFDDAAELIHTGADKVIINSCAYRDPAVITATARTFGSQAVVVCVDARRVADGRGWELLSDCGRIVEPVAMEAHLRDVLAAGAGEIMVQSVDRDGTMTGFDLPLVRAVMAVATVPVIAAGGSGDYEHLRQVFDDADVSAVACGSLFNFSDSNPIRAKAHLTNHGIAFKTT